MAESIDIESFGTGHSRLLKNDGPKDQRAIRTRAAWDDLVKELTEETNIPHISYSYFDKTNTFEVRLRGSKDKIVRMEWGEMRVIEKGIMPFLHKNFIFKGEGKSAYFNKADTEKWLIQIYKWARSLDGKKEMEDANGTQAQAKAL